MRWLGAVLSIAVGIGAGCDDTPKSKPDPTGPAPTEAAHVQAEAAAPPAPDPLEAAAPADLVAHGKELVGKYECSRCHEIEGIEAATLELNCALCHQQIRAGTFTADRKNLPHYQKRVKSLIDVPKLEGTGRLRRSWLASFLPDAHDLRPNLAATMPRFEMPAEDAEAIAAFLVPEAEQDRPELGDATKGRPSSRGRGACRATASAVRRPSRRPRSRPSSPPTSTPARSSSPPTFASPVTACALPTSWRGSKIQGDQGQHLDAQPLRDRRRGPGCGGVHPASGARADRIPVDPAAAQKPTERVTYQHVYDRVFGKICRHCHSDPDEVIGDGGPGYIGGFGFRQRKLDLSSFQGTLSGSLDDNGKRPQPVQEERRGRPPGSWRSSGRATLKSRGSRLQA